ncbi:MAG TPA: hypothetical protein DD621_01435 [Clostridiales bacterium]|nr:hypothetical protein [Clostridiales bacterium]
MATNIRENVNKSSGISIRCFSSLPQSDQFYAMESINIDDNGRIEGFTKYIGHGEGKNNFKIKLSPVIRFDLGGNIHTYNTIANKYFNNNVDTPHIHFCRINSNNRIEENALEFKDLISYLQDLGEIRNNDGQLVNGQPESDINTNSYGMPYLAQKKEYEQKYGKDSKEFQLLITNMVNTLKQAQQLLVKLNERINLLVENQQEVNKDLVVNMYRYSILSIVSAITQQANLNNYFNTQVLQISQSINKVK